MANGKKSDIGTDKYFSGIVSRTIFDGIRPTKSNAGFIDRLKEISGNAAKALEEMYDDLEKNKITVQFMERDQVSGLEKLADQLYEAAKFISVSVRRSASDIKSKLKSLALSSRYSLREVQQIAADIKKGVQFNKPPYKKIDDALMKAALAYNLFDKSRANKGKNGKTLGTRDYSEQMAKSVFCDGFIRSSDFRLDNSYKEMIRKQIEGIINKIKSDVKSKQNSDEYMEYTERERVMDIVNELAKHCSGNPANGLDKELEKLRRLEDFNNKVIKIDKTGSSYPVDAELIWERGKNKLKISTKVYFSANNVADIPMPSELLPTPPSPEPGPPPDWTPEYEARRRSERAEAERQWQEALARAQSELDAKIKSRKSTVMQGFRQWAGTYTVFGGQNVAVEMDINETSVNSDAVSVILTDSSDFLKSLPFGLDGLNTSMSWGGKGIYDWSPTGSKIIILRHDDSDTAMHEFGHSLGLGDAYGGSVFGSGVNANDFVDLVESANAGGYNANDFIMKCTGSVRNNDIEMVILAFATGKRQNYQKQFPWDKISEALGKGN